MYTVPSNQNPQHRRSVRQNVAILGTGMGVIYSLWVMPAYISFTLDAITRLGMITFLLTGITDKVLVLCLAFIMVFSGGVFIILTIHGSHSRWRVWGGRIFWTALIGFAVGHWIITGEPPLEGDPMPISP